MMVGKMENLEAGILDEDILEKDALENDILEMDTLEKDTLEKNISEQLMGDMEDHITFIVLVEIENELDLAFEDNNFIVTVQELDIMDTLQEDGDFSNFFPNDAEDVESSNSKLLVEVEIMLDLQEEIKSLEEEEIYLKEDIDIMEQKQMNGYDADISEEDEEEGVKKDNDGVHYEHSCKRTYMFNPRYSHLPYSNLSSIVVQVLKGHFFRLQKFVILPCHRKNWA